MPHPPKKIEYQTSSKTSRIKNQGIKESRNEAIKRQASRIKHQESRIKNQAIKQSRIKNKESRIKHQASNVKQSSDQAIKQSRN